LSSAHGEAGVGTAAFARAVIARLGQQPERLKAVHYAERASSHGPVQTSAPASVEVASGQAPTRLSSAQRYGAVPKRVADKRLVGVDIFLHAADVQADALAQQLLPLAGSALELQMITNRGVKVWPGGFPETFCTDHWRCRFFSASGAAIAAQEVPALMTRCTEASLDVIKTENLCTFDGERGFALGQGQS
jgi:isocitrate dehydrogenase